VIGDVDSRFPAGIKDQLKRETKCYLMKVGVGKKWVCFMLGLFGQYQR